MNLMNQTRKNKENIRQQQKMLDTTSEEWGIDNVQTTHEEREE
jgi:hypothetical protein